MRLAIQWSVSMHDVCRADTHAELAKEKNFHATIRLVLIFKSDSRVDPTLKNVRERDSSQRVGVGVVVAVDVDVVTTCCCCCFSLLATLVLQP